MSPTKEEIAAIRKRLAASADTAMHSGCGEYECDCHRDMPRILNALEAAERQRDRAVSGLRSRLRGVIARIGPATLPEDIRAELEELHNSFNAWVDSSAESRLEAAEAERDELQATFDLRWKADMRAIKEWQAKTGQVLTWPDHADLCVTLLAERDKLREALRNLLGFCDASPEGETEFERAVIRARAAQDASWKGKECGSSSAT